MQWLLVDSQVAQPSPLTRELFHGLQKKPKPISCQASSHPHPLTTPNVLHLYKFTSSGYFMQGNHILCVLLWFISSTNNAFRVCCSTCQFFIPFCDWKIGHCRVCVILHHIFFVHSSVDWHLGCFYFLVLMNNAAMNTCVWAFVWTCVSISLGSIHGRGIAGSYGNSIFSFLGPWQTVDSGCVIYTPSSRV